MCEEVRRNTDGPVSTAVIYNGVDPDIFYPEPDSLPSSVILSVGNLIPSKGHELLLRAFGAIEQRHPTLRCEIIGDGPERARLTALGAQLGPAQSPRENPSSPAEGKALKRSSSTAPMAF